MELVPNTPLDNVEVPEWSKSPEEFLGTMRAGLESNVASSQLHLWIDLVFGCKQNSIESFNQFNPECYNVDWGLYPTSLKRDSIATILKEFGIVPTQIFTQPHHAKSFNLTYFSPETPETKAKWQELHNQVQNATQVHEKEFKVQEKQYKQLLNQEAHEKQDITELKNKLSDFNSRHLALLHQLELLRK
jgi:Beige/BEACH domain